MTHKSCIKANRFTAAILCSTHHSNSVLPLRFFRFYSCTANFNQGWPKFAQLLIFSTSDGGAAVGALAPVSGMLPSGANVTVDTDFPYSDVVVVRVQVGVRVEMRSAL